MLDSDRREVPQSFNPERDELVRKLSWMWLPKGTVAQLLVFPVVTSQWIAGIVAHPAAEGLRVAANGVVSQFV